MSSSSSSTEFYLDGVFQLLLSSVGIVINAYAVVSLCSRMARSTAIFHRLMLSLVIYDLLYCALVMVVYSLPHFSDFYRDRVQVHLLPFLIPATQISLAGSCFTTVALTVERYISVCVPFFKTRHNVRAWMFVLPVLVFVVTYGSPRFFEMSTAERFEEICTNVTDVVVSDNSNDEGKNCRNETWTEIEINAIRMNQHYITIYANWMNLIVNIFFPLGLMIALNIRIYRAMRRSRSSGSTTTTTTTSGLVRRHSEDVSAANEVSSHGIGATRPSVVDIRRSNANQRELRRRDARFTRASVFMVAAFVVCNSPRFIPNIMEMAMSLSDFPQWVAVLISVNQLLTVANSSFNFLIYLSFCMRKGGGGGGNGGRNYGNNKENSSNNVVNLRRFSSGATALRMVHQSSNSSHTVL